VDKTRCPLCGGDNACGVARGEGNCWCFTTPVPADVIERVPADLRDVACVCAACAAGKRSPTAAQATLEAPPDK